MKLDNEVSLQPFSNVLGRKTTFAIKMPNHCDKQTYAIQELALRQIFEPVFEVSSNSNHEAKTLQRRGTQIRVNTWTGSYASHVLTIFD